MAESKYFKKPTISTHNSDLNCHETYQASRDVNQISILFYKCNASEAI